MRGVLEDGVVEIGSGSDRIASNSLDHSRNHQLQRLFERINRYNPALDRALLFNATHCAGYIGKKMADFRQGMHHSSFSSVWFTAQPIAAALTTRVFILACIWYTSYYLTQTLQCFVYVLKPDTHRFRHYRFTALELRGDGTSSCPAPATASIDAFGILLDHCPGEGSWPLLHAGPHALLSFNQSVLMNRWWFRTRKDAGPEADPVRFTLSGCGVGNFEHSRALPGSEASAEEECNVTDETAWHLLSSSAWIARPCAPPLMVDGPYPTRVERGASENFELRPQLAQQVELAALVLLTCANAMLVFFGSVGSQRHSRKVLVSVWFTSAVLFGLSGGWLNTRGDATLILGASSLFGVQFAWMFLFERHLVSYFCGIGALRVLYGSLCVAYIRSRGGQAATVSIHHWVGLSQVFLGAWVLVARWRVVRGARQLVAADCDMYRRIWQDVQLHEHFQKTQEALRAELAPFHESATRPPPRQRQQTEPNNAKKVRRNEGRSGEREGAEEDQDAERGVRAPFLPMAEKGSEGGGERVRDNREGETEGARHQEEGVQAEGSWVWRWAGGGRWFQMGSSSLVRVMAGPSAVFKVPSAETQGEGELVTCIDRALLQAAMLVPALSSKIVAWSLESNGCCFLDHPSKRIVPWALALADPPETIACVKRPERAMEKVLRLYRDDVSLLTDLCRASIVFEHLSDLHQCVRAILSDPDCQVVRAKNRYTSEYDAEHTAGYRDVALNLRLTTDQTREQGLAGHVCEVQLLLKPFAQTKSQQGHARYVVFRNALGT